MRELLIRYLLGELDEFEHDEVQRRLVESPELRRELAHLRSCIAHSHEDDEPLAGPPKDLATRTAVRVSESDEFPAWKPPVRAAADPPAGVLGWSLADLTVAGGVVLAFSMLLFPALGDSRNATRRTVCQNNLMQLWQSATQFANDRGDHYPKVAPHENAGIFASTLVEKGYVAPEEMKLILVCPAAPFADDIRDGVTRLEIPTREQLAMMSPKAYRITVWKMSPFYDYRLPYRLGDEYVDVKAVGSPYEPVFADRACSRGEEYLSPNHGGPIIQVVFQDGHVRTLKSRMSTNPHDDMSYNSMGLPAAGWGPRDIVLGRGESPPAPELHQVQR